MMVEPDASQLRVGVAVAAYNAFVTDGLLTAALKFLKQAGCDEPRVVTVSGALELPLAVRALARSGCDAVVALGAVIEGETDHYTHVATQSYAGLCQVMLETDVPVGFGVLTARDASQAKARSEPGPGNRGAEAAEAAVRSAAVLRQLRSSLK